MTFSCARVQREDEAEAPAEEGTEYYETSVGGDDITLGPQEGGSQDTSLTIEHGLPTDGTVLESGVVAPADGVEDSKVEEAGTPVSGVDTAPPVNDQLRQAKEKIPLREILLRLKVEDEMKYFYILLRIL